MRMLKNIFANRILGNMRNGMFDERQASPAGRRSVHIKFKKPPVL